MKNTLLHAVSHDLKGPLAGVLGAMQTIRRAEKLHLTDKEMDDLYGVIEQAGAKAARLVEDLLDLDRLDRGQLEPQREPTDVESIADRAGRASSRRSPAIPCGSTAPACWSSVDADDDRADRREPAEQRRAAHAARHADPRRGRGTVPAASSSSSRTRARACPTRSRPRSSSRSGRARTRAAAWASGCPSSAGSPSCTAARRTSRIATAAARGSSCVLPGDVVRGAPRSPADLQAV